MMEKEAKRFQYIALYFTQFKMIPYISTYLTTFVSVPHKCSSHKVVSCLAAGEHTEHNFHASLGITSVWSITTAVGGQYISREIACSARHNRIASKKLWLDIPLCDFFSSTREGRGGGRLVKETRDFERLGAKYQRGISNVLHDILPKTVDIVDVKCVTMSKC
jgi:hypothetical protein